MALETPERKSRIGFWKFFGICVGGAVALYIILTFYTSLNKEKRTVHVTLVSEGGLLVPDHGFLYLEVEEEIRFVVQKETPKEDVDLYLDVLFGERVETPKSVKSHSIRSAVVRPMLHRKREGAATVAEALIRYKPTVPNGLIQRTRKHFFESARYWQAEGSVLLPVGRWGVKEVDWALLDLGIRSLGKLPHQGEPVNMLKMPLQGAPRITKNEDLRTHALRDPLMGRLVLAFDPDYWFSVLGLDGSTFPEASGQGWDGEWHPKMEFFYVAGEGGVRQVHLDGRVSEPLLNGERFRQVRVSPDGMRIMLLPAGLDIPWLSIDLDDEGFPLGFPLDLPGHVSNAAYHAWEPGSGHVLWCFGPEKNKAWRIDISTGEALGTWVCAAEGAELKAVQGGTVPTVIMTYPRPGRPQWDRAVAYLDLPTLEWVGVDLDPPVDRLVWSAVDAE